MLHWKRLSQLDQKIVVILFVILFASCPWNLFVELNGTSQTFLFCRLYEKINYVYFCYFDVVDFLLDGGKRSFRWIKEPFLQEYSQYFRHEFLISLKYNWKVLCGVCVGGGVTPLPQFFVCYLNCTKNHSKSNHSLSKQYMIKSNMHSKIAGKKYLL